VAGASGGTAGSAETLGIGKPRYPVAQGLNIATVTDNPCEITRQALRGIGIRGLVDGCQALADIVDARALEYGYRPARVVGEMQPTCALPYP
jgi:hypothetical protein